MNNYLIKNATIINENLKYNGSIYIQEGKIKDLFFGIAPDFSEREVVIIDAEGKYVIPGVIDCHVHFREPGLTHKGDIHSESRAAAAGGVTSFMDMPNTYPPAVSRKLLEEKFTLASKQSLANYSFYIGATNDNLSEIMNIDPAKVCGIKVFMGASTGNMLVDNSMTLTKLFSMSNLLIAVHCEDEKTIATNVAKYKSTYGENIPVKYHTQIRSAEACYISSSYAVDLARRYNTRLHLLHISSAGELALLEDTMPTSQKRITAETGVHFLWFDENDYERMGARIKWNPSVKSANDRNELLKGLSDNKIDIISTDHAPHLAEEKDNPYFKAQSGAPCVQHSLCAMLELSHQGKISIEQIIGKMCHAPADAYKIDRRGYIRKGYWADLLILDLNRPWTVTKENILYRCGWSTFEGQTFQSSVTHTFVNGNMVYREGTFDDSVKGQRLKFIR